MYKHLQGTGSACCGTHTHSHRCAPASGFSSSALFFFFLQYRNVRSATERFGKHVHPFGKDSADFIDVNPRLLTALMDW